MITGFCAPPRRRNLLSFDFLVICFFMYFSCYIFRTFFVHAQILTSIFLVQLFAYSSSFCHNLAIQ